MPLSWAAAQSKKVVRKNAIIEYAIIAENVVIEKDAVVGVMPEGDEKGVATVGSGVTVGEGAVVGPKAMVSEDVKGGDKVW